MLILLLLAIETAGLSADQGTQASKAAEVLQDAKVLIQTGQVLRARQLAEQVRNQDFPDASIQNELGKVFESTGDLPQAQAAYRRSVALDPLTEDYWLDLVSLLLLLDQPHEALSLLRGAIGRLPNSYPLRLALGTALEASGEKNEALHIFEQATQKDPDRAPAYVLYGKLASLMARRKPRYELYERQFKSTALTREPDTIWVWRKGRRAGPIGSVWKNFGRPSKSIPIIRWHGLSWPKDWSARIDSRKL